MIFSASKSKAPSVLKQSLITSGFILLLGIWHTISGKSNPPDSDESQEINPEAATEASTKESKSQKNKDGGWGQKFVDYINGKIEKTWKSPTKAKVVSYDIALALLPVVIAAIGAAIGAAMVGTATEDSGKYLPFFILAYVLYFVFAFWVIVSRATIGKLVYGENDVTGWPIYLWIIVPALVSGVSTAVLKDSPILSVFISLALLALITYKSQRHLSLPLSFLQEAEENSNKEKAEQG